MARFKGFIGNSYLLHNSSYDCQRTLNFFPEVHEVQLGKGAEVMQFSRTPGLTLLTNTPVAPMHLLDIFTDSDGTLIYEHAPDIGTGLTWLNETPLPIATLQGNAVHGNGDITRVELTAPGAVGNTPVPFELTFSYPFTIELRLRTEDSVEQDADIKLYLSTASTGPLDTGLYARFQQGRASVTLDDYDVNYATDNTEDLPTTEVTHSFYVEETQVTWSVDGVPRAPLAFPLSSTFHRLRLTLNNTNANEYITRFEIREGT